MNKRRKQLREAGLNGDINDYSTVIIFSVVACVFLGMFWFLFLQYNDYKDRMAYETNIAKMYEEVEREKVGIKFNVISNTNEEFEVMNKACTDYLEDNITDKTKVDVDTTINEETYIDKKSSDEVMVEVEDESMVETGPIYMQDSIIVRYINNIGEMTVLYCDKDNNISPISDLAGAESDYNIRKGGVPIEEYSTSEVPESDYLGDLANTFISVLRADTKKGRREAELGAMKYFTYDSRQTLISTREIYNKSKSTMQIEYVKAGKSDLAITNKNRVFMQISVKNGSSIELVNIVVKLDNNNRVFDIDIL